MAPSPSNPDDLTLRRARSGDPAALRQVHDALAPAVLGYARGQGVDDPDAVANETMYRALRDLGTFVGDARRYRSWVFAVAHNLIIDERRRRARRPRTVELDGAVDVTVDAPDPGDAATERLEVTRVLSWIADLSPDQRDVLLLRLVSDLPIAEVADIVGKRPGAVKALQRRGLAALRRRLLDEAVSPSPVATFTQTP